jgi:hypothetical protein
MAVCATIERRNAASIFAPPVRARRWPTSATTGAGTRMSRRARCRLVSRSVQARLSRSSRSAAATSGPVSQTIAQERPKPSASRSSWLRPRSVRPLENEANQTGGHSVTGGGSCCRAWHRRRGDHSRPCRRPPVLPSRPRTHRFRRAPTSCRAAPYRADELDLVTSRGASRCCSGGRCGSAMRRMRQRAASSPIPALSGFTEVRETCRIAATNVSS